MKLKIGENYLTRNGTEIRLTRYIEDDQYPWRGVDLQNNRFCFTPEGDYHNGLREHGLDLVQRKPKATFEPETTFEPGPTPARFYVRSSGQHPTRFLVLDRTYMDLQRAFFLFETDAHEFCTILNRRSPE